MTVYPHYKGEFAKGEFARVITFKTEYAQNLIDNFSNKDKAPWRIWSPSSSCAPKRSSGRCSDVALGYALFGPGQHKEFFFLFDYCQNLKYFSAARLSRLYPEG